MRWPTISELVARIKNGELSVAELVRSCLDEIEKTREYNAVLEINQDALDRAKEIDDRIAAGKTEGVLLGVPFLAKDNFLTHHTHTTAASNILKPFKAPYQATAIERLEAEGAIMLGKVNLDEFAHGSSTENSAYGPTKNPYDKTKVPGGSSGGSGAAIALDLAAFALGTDTGGSIRLPASFCGVVGLKPTYGLVSRYGVIAMASSTDVIGPLTRSVEDSAYVLDVLAARDPKDATTIERSEKPYRLSDGIDVSGLKIGVIKEHMRDGVEADVAAAIKESVQALEDAGATIKEISIPADEVSLAVYYILAPAEISSNLSRYDGIKYGHSAEQATSLLDTYLQSRGEGFGDEPKRRIMIGAHVLKSGYVDAYYKKAQAVRTVIKQQYEKAFEGVDIMVGPVSPSVAFDLGGKLSPLEMYLTDIMTTSASLVGSPAISVPVGKNGNLPIGMQLMARQRDETTLLRAAAAVEAARQEEVA